MQIQGGGYEKEKLKRILLQNEAKQEKELHEKYNPDEIFKKAGFELEEFGENTIKLNGVPTVCYDLDTKEVKLYLNDTTLYADFTINIYGFEDRYHEIDLSLDGFHNFSLGEADYDSAYGQYLKYPLSSL